MPWKTEEQRVCQLLEHISLQWYFDSCYDDHSHPVNDLSGDPIIQLQYILNTWSTEQINCILPLLIDRHYHQQGQRLRNQVEPFYEY